MDAALEQNSKPPETVSLALLAGAVLLLAFAVPGCSPSATGTTTGSRQSQKFKQGSVVQVSNIGAGAQGGAPAQRIDLGSVKQGGSIRKTISIENQTSALFTIDRIEASCECTSFPGLPLNVPAGGNGQLEIVADESHETEFHGGLGIQATAFDHTQPLFKFEIDINVEPRVLTTSH